MTLVQFLRLIHSHLRLVIGVPLLLGLIVGIVTLRKPLQFRSQAMIHTGLVSAINVLDVQNNRVDYFAVNSSFDNLISMMTSREILRKTGLQLISTFLADNEGDISLSEDAQLVRAKFAEEFDGRWTRGMTYDTVVVLLEEYRHHPLLEDLLQADESPVSITRLSSNLTVKRIGVSDMLELSFLSEDPTVAKLSLDILLDVFMHDYKIMKSSQAGSMASFFQGEVQKAADLLRSKSEELRAFRIDNRIINYDEQTEQITVQQMNVETEYRTELRTLSASEASLADLNVKLGDRAEMILRNKEVLRLQDALTQKVQSISEGRIASDSSASASSRVGTETLREKLHAAVETASQAVRTSEGVSKSSLLQEWLRSYLSVIEGQARVSVLRKSIDIYAKQVDRFAPLGSSLRSMERDIDVAEREYLELLHSLNVTRLREQNLEMSSQLRVVDAPDQPRTPESSKRFVLVLGTLFLGLMLIVGVVIAAEYLDRSVSSPERVIEATHLPLIGALPNTEIRKEDGQGVESLVRQLARNVSIELDMADGAAESSHITVISTRDGEGKTTVLNELKDRLAYATPVNGGELNTDEKIVAIESPMDEKGPGTGSPRRVQITECPSIVNGMLPLELLSRSTLILLVIRSDRSWTKADERALALLRRVTQGQIMVVLNGITLDSSEELVGDVPKQRTSMRRLVKRIASFELSASFSRRAA
jgi:uncharacterized protein involved in exopolysaccharide biosynthesis